MLKIKNTEDFSAEIEKLVATKHLTYLEATIEYLTICEIDYDSIRLKNLLNAKIKKRIRLEAKNLKMFPKKRIRKKNKKKEGSKNK